MREKKICHCKWQLQHLDCVEQFLEAKAKQGWFVYKYIGSLFYFKKGTPKDTRYYAEVYEKVKWNNSFENDKNKGFIKECGEHGWKFVYANSKFQIFSTESKGSAKPKLAERIKVDSIHKSYFKEYFYLILCLLFMVCCNIVTGFLGLVRILTSFSQFLQVVTWVVFAGYLIAYIMVHRRWYKKACINAKLNQEIVEHPHNRIIKIGLIVIMAMLAIIIVGFFIENKTFQAKGAFTRCLCLFVIVGVILANMSSLHKNRIWSRIAISFCIGLVGSAIYVVASRQSSIFKPLHKVSDYNYENAGKSIMIKKYEDPIPLTLADFGIQKKDNILYSTYHEVNGEFVIKKDFYSEEPLLSTADNDISKEPALYYTVYHTSDKYLYHRILTDECYNGEDANTYDILENTKFKAKKIYKRKLDDKYYEYIFLFDNTIVEVNITNELTEKQLEKVRDFT